MKEEVRRWWVKAQRDMSDAEYNLNGKRYETAAFLCQQAVEKALKALLIDATQGLLKTHDLVELGRLVHLPQPLHKKAQELTTAYIYSRYPDVRQERDLGPLVREFLAYTKEVLVWSKKQLSSKN